MITREDIERLGKAQEAAGRRYMEELMSPSDDVQACRDVFVEYEVAVKEWKDAAQEFIKQKKEQQS